MRMSALIAAGALLSATPAFAQSDVKTTTTPAAFANTKDVNKTAAAPVAGKNSFTAAQVTKRLQDNGYSNVTGLAQDDKSVWHGNAMKGGATVSVAVDYQGNITAN